MTDLSEAVKAHRAQMWRYLHTPRPRSEWNEDMGDVLWWQFPISEPPYIGTPNDLGQTVEMHAHGGKFARMNVGGWSDDYTHWTPLPDPETIQRAFNEGQL